MCVCVCVCERERDSYEFSIVYGIIKSKRKKIKAR
jgi:hypothetical protein